MATLCLDNNFISDYLGEPDYTTDFLRQFDSSDTVLLPTIVWFEALTPAFRSGDGRTPSRVRSALSGFDLTSFDGGAAEEAADIRGNLLDRGEPLGSPDVLIAGIARYHDADVVTDDRAFERVPGITVRNPKREMG